MSYTLIYLLGDMLFVEISNCNQLLSPKTVKLNYCKKNNNNNNNKKNQYYTCFLLREKNWRQKTKQNTHTKKKNKKQNK